MGGIIGILSNSCSPFSFTKRLYQQRVGAKKPSLS